MIKAVIFDLWETIVFHSGPKPTKEAINTLGRPYESPYTRMLEEVIMVKRFKTKRDAFLELCRRFEVEATEDLLLRLEELWEDVHEKTHYYPEVQETISLLKKKGYKIGLLSNTTAFSSSHLDNDMKEMFDSVVLSCDDGTLKPDKESFELALKRLGVGAKEAVMVGDYPPSDMACEKYGIIGILIDRKKKYVGAKGAWSYRIENLKEIIPLLNKINDDAQKRINE